jgi:hypothetical protein
MPTPPTRTARIARLALPALAALAAGVALAGCGSSSAQSRQAAREARGVKYSDCMRSHGVPNFPDPKPGGGGFNLPPGVNPFAPSFKAAHSSCANLFPFGRGGGLKASEQLKQQLVATAECMRRHGVTGFPDPTTVPPSNPAAYSSMVNFGGIIVAIPDTINEASPAFQQARKACGFAG